MFEVNAEISKLHNRCDLLQARVKALESILFGKRPVPTRWKLTAVEARIFQLVMSRERVSLDALEAASVTLDPDKFNKKQFAVHLCHLRAKLKALGVPVEIKTLRYDGIYVDTATRRAWREGKIEAEA